MTFYEIIRVFLLLSTAMVLTTGYRTTHDSYRQGSFYRTNLNLTEIPTDIPDGATKVYLFWNQIPDVRPGAFSHLTSCREIILNDNQLQEVRADMWEGLDSLEELGLSTNLIQDIPDGTFIELNNLRTLGLSANKIPELRSGMWIGLVLLEELHIGKNLLTQIKVGMFDGLPFLRRLWLWGNKIDTIEHGSFTSLGNLKNLYLEHNSLVNIDGGMWLGLNLLSILNLRGNKITELKHGSLGNLPVLQEVFLDNNNLSSLPEDVFGSHSNHPSKVYLGLTDNPLQCDRRVCWILKAEKDGWLYITSIWKPTLVCDSPRVKWEDLNVDCSDYI